MAQKRLLQARATSSREAARTTTPLSPSPVHPVLQLQATIGNRAKRRLLERTASGHPVDAREAPPSVPSGSVVQRQTKRKAKGDKEGTGSKRPKKSSSDEETLNGMEPMKGLPGFFTGKVPEENRPGTRMKVWSETEPIPMDQSPMSFSSGPLTQRARKLLSEFGGTEHLADEKNTHAEDRLSAYVAQVAIEMFYKSGKMPESVVIPQFFVSASPCTSEGETSGKDHGCTENIIKWHKNGVAIKSEEGCVFHVKLTITNLVVHHLYKSNSRNDAEASRDALRRLRTAGAIEGWEVLQPPNLKDFPLK